MAKIDFDVLDANGQPTVTFGIDFDGPSAEQLAIQLGLDDKTGAKLAAAVKGLAPDAAAQKKLNKLVATAIHTGIAAAKAGVAPSTLLGGLV